MYKTYTIRFVFVFLFAFVTAAQGSFGMAVDRVEPAFWWTGMKNKQLQIMLHGEGVGKAKAALTYPGVSIANAARTDNSNYLFLYLNISSAAKPGIMHIKLTGNGGAKVIDYELKARTDKSGAAGFSQADVLYLLTPDRFANGDPSNDNWDGVNINRENPDLRHGGDLKGVEDHLDYIKDLGVTTVWFNPVQENKMPNGSYHGYAITDFYSIDKRFGSNNEFKSLVNNMHGKGLKVVMDMIFNHCGLAHPWMKDKPAADWVNNPGKYAQTNHAKVTIMDPHAAKSERDILIDGWFVPDMPDLNQRNRHLATYLIQNSIWWIEYARIDGIRQDTYPYPDYDFMARWCKAVTDEYPNFNIVGESWYGKSGETAWWQRGSALHKNNTYLKTVMDFPLTFTADHGFDEDANKGGGESSGIYQLFEVIAQDFLYPDANNILTFLDNHDMGRFTRKEDKDLRRFKLAFAFLLTTRGIPQVYYGTEILMQGTKNEGDGQIRKDFPGGWPGDKTNSFAATGRSEEQNEAFDYLQKLLKWRQRTEAIKSGKLIHYAPWDGVYVYARIKDKRTVLVMLNSSGSDRTVKMDRFKDVTANHNRGTDIISDKSIDISSEVTIPARGEYILELK